MRTTLTNKIYTAYTRKTKKIECQEKGDIHEAARTGQFIVDFLLEKYCRLAEHLSYRGLQVAVHPPRQITETGVEVYEVFVPAEHAHLLYRSRRRGLFSSLRLRRRWWRRDRQQLEVRQPFARLVCGPLRDLRHP